MDSASSSPGPLKDLTASRARFIAELGERIGALRQGLARMATLAEPTTELNAVRRRLHALAAAAEVLRFAPAAEALAAAEAALASSSGAPGRERVARVLDLLPSLVLGVSLELAAELDAQRHDALREPLCVLVYGDPSLLPLLHAPGPLRSVEAHVTSEPDQLLAWLAHYSPDLLLIDADVGDASDVLPRLRQAAGSRVVPIVAVGSFDQHELLLRLVRRGVSRLQPRPVDAGTLQRTLRQVSTSQAAQPARAADFRRVTPAQLVAAITREAEKAFGISASRAPPAPTLDLGSGAEVLGSLWGAFARIRGLAIAASDGLVSFPAPGPHGAIPVAPAMAAPAAAPSSVTPSVNLAGRRFIVVDDDPAVLTLLSRALAQLGAVALPARNAAQALSLAERQWPDAVLSDALLPDLDGFELCQRIREDIALADLPVALVAWKDHLLESARAVEDTPSVTAGLDPRSIAPALEDCLRERAALERRLAQHDEVHGRLDGLTPRSLLQLVCSRAPNALVTLLSGRFRYAVSVVDGRPVHAQLYEDDESVGQGAEVLGPLLGVRAGRFGVRPLFSPPAAHFTGDLLTVLEPAIARARRATDRLRDGDLSSIERVVLDAFAVAQYLDESPGSHRSVVARLEAGAAPRSLAPASESRDGEAPRVLAALLELSRRGAIVALLDREGRDVLSAQEPADPPLVLSRRAAAAGDFPPESPAAPPRESRAAVPLGEAVLHAISAPAPEPSAARTQPGWAPPEGPRQHPSTPPLPSGVASSEAKAASVPPEPAEAGSPPPANEPREVPEAWSSEPEEEDEDDAAVEDGARGLDEAPEIARSTSPGARLRSVGSPLLITVAAAAVAFMGIRAVAGGGWQTLSAALQGAPPSADAGSGPEAVAAPEPVTRPASSHDLGLLAEQRKIPVDVVFTSELLDLPQHTKLRPGHGLLEVHTWEPQRMYVDGVFMGNYASRLIPLAPGTYQVRLRDGARDMERPVEVEAGRRTRLWARPKSSK